MLTQIDNVENFSIEKGAVLAAAQTCKGRQMSKKYMFRISGGKDSAAPIFMPKLPHLDIEYFRT